MDDKQKLELAEKLIGDSPPKRGSVRLSVDLSAEAIKKLESLTDTSSSRTMKAREVLALATMFAATYRGIDAVKLDGVWAKQLKALETINFDYTRTSSFKALQSDCRLLRKEGTRRSTQCGVTA